MVISVVVSILLEATWPLAIVSGSVAGVLIPTKDFGTKSGGWGNVVLLTLDKVNLSEDLWESARILLSSPLQDLSSIGFRYLAFYQFY